MKRMGKGSLEQGLRLESLEERIAPAGAVAVKAAGANLTITGDAEANEFVIDQPAAGQVHVVGVNGTLVNGQAEVTFDAVTGNVSLKMGDGNDNVTINGLEVDKNFSFDGGAGGDNLWFDAANVLGSVSVKAGDGDDTTFFNAAALGSKFSYSGGKGNDGLVMMDCAVVGAVKASGDAGSDAISFIGATDFSGAAMVSTAGDLNFTAAGSIAGLLTAKGGKGSFVVDLAGLTLGALKYTGGATVADFSMTASTCLGDASINTGAGLAGIDFAGAVVQGSLTVKGGKGEFLMDAVDLTVFETASLTSGSTDSDLTVVDSTLGIDAINSTVSDVKVKISGDVDAEFENCNFGRDFIATGSGREDADFHLEGGDVARNVSIKNSAAEAVVEVSCTVHGTTTITTGGGWDEIWFDGAHLVGALTVKTGGGEDYLWFDSYDDPAGLTSAFDGPVFADMGSGEDELYIGSLGDGNAAAFGDALILNGGSGYDYAEYLTYDNTFAVDPVLNSFEDTE